MTSLPHPPAVDAALAPPLARMDTSQLEECQLAPWKLVIGLNYRVPPRNLTGLTRIAKAEGQTVYADSGPTGSTEALDTKSLNVVCRHLVVRSQRVGPRGPWTVDALGLIITLIPRVAPDLAPMWLM